MLKLVSTAVLSLSMLAGSAFADSTDAKDASHHSRERYICSSDDDSTFVRVFPGQLRATIERSDGRPSYEMACREDSGNYWLICKGRDGRTLFFNATEATYRGSVKTTELTCARAD